MTGPDVASDGGDELARMREKRASARLDDEQESGEDTVGGESAAGGSARPRAADRRHPSNNPAAPERPVVITDDDVDDQVLEMRSQGRSFKKIAKVLGFDSTSGPIKAFNRSLRRRPTEEQASLLAQELDRLQTLEQQVRADTTTPREEVDRRLRAVTRIRAIVSAG